MNNLKNPKWSFSEAKEIFDLKDQLIIMYKKEISQLEQISESYRQIINDIKFVNTCLNQKIIMLKAGQKEDEGNDTEYFGKLCILN